jgi:hypothetical protein
MTGHDYPPIALGVRETLLAAGYREATDLPARAAFRLSWSAALAKDRPAVAGVEVSLELDAPAVNRRAVFAGYATALILAGFHVDYRGRYLHVHGKPKEI